MKRITALLLCALLVFNWCGYRLMLYYFQDKSGIQLQTQLDAGSYDNAQLVSIKIPAAHLSFYTNSGQFERTNGNVEIAGILYKYVEKRFYNDSLEFLCVPDHAAMQWQATTNELFKQVNDLQQNAQGKKAASQQTVSQHFAPDYYPSQNISSQYNAFFLNRHWITTPVEPLQPAFLFTAEQPPETIS